eukprot:CAMPEP_0184553838 /NCGR_PEP_ID=MMETSP0199_2-20130426/33349_1 /TAXON_ID=1112570 /ORGANISM="Thraustochytrium sp., Strain LLF1b" /LENGTH=421 /DNA_ID=CAMNT_0026949709 /DNA_START=52 /DNA_END=1313 /DNA_ORIENTATION=-
MVRPLGSMVVPACGMWFLVLWWWIGMFDVELWRYHASTPGELSATLDENAFVFGSERTQGDRTFMTSAMVEHTLLDVRDAVDHSTRPVGNDVAALAKALEEDRGMKVVLACITRDDFDALQQNMAQIEEVGSHFDDYRVVVVENDSSKAFRSILKNWSSRNSRVKVISKTFNLEKRPTLGFLAKMRNLYLDELQNPEYDSFQRVILFDMDVGHRWPIKDIVGSTAMPLPKYGVRCFHIYNHHGGHRDVLAFRDAASVPKYTFAQYPNHVSYTTVHEVYALTQVWWKRNRSPRVESCFGGMAAYSMEALRTCRYDETSNECEHLGLNKCISEAGLSIVLDTLVAIPYNYHELKDGLPLVMLFWYLPHMLVAFVLGALRFRYVHGRSTHLSQEGEIYIAGTIAVTWYAFLGKDNNDTSHLLLL